jgi:hypothetical protein
MAKDEKSAGSVVVQEAREEIRRIAFAHGAVNVRVFGSTDAANMMPPAISIFLSIWRRAAACSI